MRITSVRTHVLEARLAEPFAYSRAWYATRFPMRPGNARIHIRV
jgi:D-galactarolactone cycloisomerase